MTKKIMQEFRIDEISFVDRPAQKGAKMTIMKRDDKEAEDIGKIQKEQPMTTKTVDIEALNKSLEDANASIKKMEGELAKAKVDASRSDDEKSFVAKMSDEDKEAFDAMSDKDKKKKMGDVKKDDETLVIKGTEIRKSEVGAAEFAIFKSLSEDAEKSATEITKARKETAFVKFEKRAADEMANLPGKDVEKANLLEAVFEAEFGTEVMATLDAIFKSANDTNEGAFKTIGKFVGEVDSDTKSKIDKATDEIMKRDSIDKIAAIAKAWSENPKLYAEMEAA